MNEREQRPRGRGWAWIPVPPSAWAPGTLAASRWTDGRLSVISTLILAELPDGSGEVGPQWHVSVSRFGKRPKPAELARAQRAFGIVGWEEDNHHPGNARHFFRPVDPARRVACECKTTETIHVEPDGYTWSNAKDEPCRGCEFWAQQGKPCPIHAKEQQ